MKSKVIKFQKAKSKPRTPKKARGVTCPRCAHHFMPGLKSAALSLFDALKEYEESETIHRKQE